MGRLNRSWIFCGPISGLTWLQSFDQNPSGLWGRTTRWGPHHHRVDEDETSTDWHQRQAVLRTVRGTVVCLGNFSVGRFAAQGEDRGRLSSLFCARITPQVAPSRRPALAELHPMSSRHSFDPKPRAQTAQNDLPPAFGDRRRLVCGRSTCWRPWASQHRC